MNAESFVCPVCSKRWGIFAINSEIIIKRCDEHQDTLSTAEIYAKGLSVGNYQKMMDK